ncbi:(deoxy)nucleoside triphosphate pyrophosphohydrolase [Geomonas subterranea]|uniref:8-oxo-dGTP diphosphatase n=1 Tax=Geomonas subterranea TaxID=2847989 RepID=A0ABX8LAP4_9BACT|nr:MULTISPECIES: (deoxy)nucleoside triphosphate pyrophosphohydrolase [Geomonas]QXE89043.1 (deoxy)nucleoside triphosphate pyrophosphohydrolase [Geomonas subterranea]QXM08838.1 (deoxy)nucleoside triphosphate pyrophosphohydrolase [Geomonas subterranea]
MTQTIDSRKHVHVACAIIERDGLVLSARRSASMNLPLRWEFPGGKIEPGEGREECLKRELVEEMGVEIAVGRPLTPTTHRYPGFDVTLYPYVCSIVSGEITLHEHSAMTWLPPGRMLELEWADADLPIILEYQREGHGAGE